MPENPRIEELRRRVDTDPASIAFAQLAEEYRRAGDYEEAARVCRAGLARHPSYLSARVTLGRALIELQQYDEAQVELERVLRSAPENLTAIRGLAEVHQRRGNIVEALRHYQIALRLSKHDPELEESVADLRQQVRSEAAHLDVPPSGRDSYAPGYSEPVSASEPPVIGVGSLSPELEAAADEFTKALQALDALTLDLPEAPLTEPTEEASAPIETTPSADDAVVSELESWLGAIVHDRTERKAAMPGDRRMQPAQRGVGDAEPLGENRGSRPDPRSLSSRS